MLVGIFLFLVLIFITLYFFRDVLLQKSITRIQTKFETDFLEKIKSIEANLIQHRNQNFIGQILQHHHHQSTKYMSLWIEQKNKNLPK